ncbi:MAG TPA: ATP-binding protein, partial [Oligoflexia bacterium]|nr:ATP-binding protein [Oligoflexia bacterium]
KHLDSLLLENSDTILLKIKTITESVGAIAQKKIEFETVCEVAALEKTLVAEIFECVLHLVRNAVDHGIEVHDERVSAGKNPVSRVAIRLSVEQRNLCITVRDDGRGIQTAKVLAVAKKRGLVPAAQKSLSETELARILFSPGFTTKEVATDLSGRGVGLDAVEAVAVRNAGTVLVRSEEGQYTEFELRIPLRMYADRLLVCRAGGTLVAFAQKQIANITKSAAKSEAPVNDAGTLLGRKSNRITQILRLMSGAEWGVEDILGNDMYVVRCLNSQDLDDQRVIGVTRVDSGEPVLVLVL